ncbi:CMRF35-like molecule 1 [Larimichthys crocea]|uniref:CMRF35-like molecule 1 n=1 Tax=Larimichthys crocea TaxID=215358 RepID=UPI000F5FD016|nr:CMRF35-like molecule 1 [Larimichthys crocea]
MKTISVFFLLLYAKWTVEASINTEGFERGEVSFQCSHSFATKNHKYFCKDPCTANTDILATVKSGERVKSERIILVDLGNGVFTVTFSQLQLSDSGRYWCAVDRPGFDTFTAVYLTVKEAVTTPAIPELSPTWTIISNSTQSTPGMDTSMVTNVTSAPNSTSGVEQNINTGTVWSSLSTRRLPTQNCAHQHLCPQQLNVA